MQGYTPCPGNSVDCAGHTSTVSRNFVCHVKGMQESVTTHFTVCYFIVQAHPPPVEVGTETDGQLQEAQAALEAQRSQAHALKRRILELQVTTLLCLPIV